MIHHPVLRFTCRNQIVRSAYCCVSSRSTSAARCRGIGLARASYWSFRHCPIAESPTRLPGLGLNLFGLREGLGSVTVLNYMPTDPIVDAVGSLSRSGNCRHVGPSLESRAARETSR